ncbi:MAG: hypothetical protein SXV54_02900 [Chloroflexota bacterium]|nr:hypothetical protein [Chloroflexota bacterium]
MKRANNVLEPTRLSCAQTEVALVIVTRFLAMLDLPSRLATQPDR